MLAKVPPQADFDTGPRNLGAGAERLCVVTRQVKPVDEMIRFVAGPQGEVVPDLKRKLPGRGIWITADRATLGEAVKRNVFAKSFKREVRVADRLVRDVGQRVVGVAVDELAERAEAGREVLRRQVRLPDHEVRPHRQDR